MLAVIKRYHVFMVAAAVLVVLAVCATAAYADDEIVEYDYTNPVELSEAILALYDKDFAQCDSTAPAPSTAATIIEGLGSGWDAVYKSWAIVKNGDSKYVLLTATDVNAIGADELAEYIPMVKVADGDCTEGYGLAKVKADYNVIDAKSYFDAAATELEMSADCEDHGLLVRILGEAVAIAKADTTIEYGAGSIARNIDSAARLSRNGVYAAPHCMKLLRAIDSLRAGKYASIGLSVDYNAVSWYLSTNGSNKVEAIYFATLTDTELNSFYARVAAGETINVRVYRYVNGRLTEGYAPLRQATYVDDYVDYRDILALDADAFAAGDPEQGIAIEALEDIEEPAEFEEEPEQVVEPAPAPVPAPVP
ncbi:MAG: hypothetical protein Q4B96_02770, partial [Bacillota bacterium]|nr:hypothetical protein [Bacillota bacterium]